MFTEQLQLCNRAFAKLGRKQDQASLIAAMHTTAQLFAFYTDRLRDEAHKLASQQGSYDSALKLLQEILDEFEPINSEDRS